jgi:addiction module RelE/StbE family toxin
LRIEWSAFALADRHAIFDYIGQDSPRATVAVDDRIREQVERLSGFPMSGPPGRIDGTREPVIKGTPYIAAYMIVEQRIRILRIIHGAQA